MEKEKSPADWKEKYRETLNKNEQKLDRYRRKIELLVKALIAVGHMAQGVDEVSDRKLAGLRGLFRQPKLPNADLESAVIALEAHARTSFLSRTQVNEQLVQELKRLAGQLRALGQSPVSKHDITKFQQRISSLEFFQDEIPGFISDIANIQQSVMHGDAVPPPASFLQRLSGFFQRDTTTVAVNRPGNGKTDAKAESSDAKASGVKASPAELATDADRTQVADEAEEIQLDLADAHLPLLSDTLTQRAQNLQTDGQGHIEDRRLSLSEWDIDPSTRSTLEYLLVALDPPKDIKQQYLIACNLVSQLENGNDLVTLLEQISNLVVATVEHDRREFESFLSQLNSRLTDAYSQIATSQNIQKAGIESRKELTSTVSQRVGSLTTEMELADSLETLKSQVSHNLSDIVSALEKHNTQGDENDGRLSQELSNMAERVKQMEKAAAKAEEKMEAQRARALVDPLTHLPNREAYDQRAHQEIARWMRYRRSLCLAVCDLDLFKKVNDEFGHLAGDKVLKVVAKILRERLRASDFISRFGGEEFVILLPETEPAEAIKVMEQIRIAIQETPFHFRHKQVQVTVSIGITLFQGKDNLNSAFTRADKALYEAKDSGRNCCRMSERPSEVSDPIAAVGE